MVDLHVCTCDHGQEMKVDGCTAVVGRDVCRFEQALADPVDAQVDAAIAAFGWPSMPEWPDVEGWRRERMREALAAAAVVVLGRPPCSSCGRPEGTGTLLDHSRTPDHHGVSLDTLRWSSAGDTTWEAFAVKFRCPACAEAVPS